MTPVGYCVEARPGIPVGVPGLAYTYHVGRNGVFVAAENAHLALTLPVAPGEIRGLLPIAPRLVLKHGTLPAVVWGAMVQIAAAVARHEREVLFQVYWTAAGYALARPRVGSGVAVRYAPQPGVVLQLHSHHVMDAYFSDTDDRDEQGFGLYGVLGRIGQEGRLPQVLLRAGCYGCFHPIAWSQVFAGTIGDVEDLHAPIDTPTGEGVPFVEESVQ